jgi:hypothetical protein
VARFLRGDLRPQPDHFAEQSQKLFNNYDENVLGSLDRRHADTVEIKDLRTWMQNMADQAIAFVNHVSGQNKN